MAIMPAILRHSGPAFVLAIYAFVLLALLLEGWPPRQDLPFAYFLSVAVGSVMQAMFSTIASVAIGTIVAVGLVRSPWGERVLGPALTAMAALPATVAAFAIIGIFGQTGLYGSLMRHMGLEPQSWIFGLPGVILAHVLLNAPLAARYGLEALRAIPAEQKRLANLLGFDWRQSMWIIEIPALRAVLPGVAQLIFLLCFTSFAVVQLLGGGPATATFEVAIYQALKINVDFGEAAGLIAIQIAFAGLLLLFWQPMALTATGLLRAGGPADAFRPAPFLKAVGTISALLLLVMPTLVLAAYVPALASLFSPRILQAIATSAWIAMLSSLFAVTFALLIAWSPLAALRRAAGFLPIVFPVFGLVAGLYLLLRVVVDPFSLAIPLVALINALTALPFALRFLESAFDRAEAQFGRLGDMLDLSGWWRFRHVVWPVAKRPAIAAGSLAAAFSFGDYGAMTFFSDGTVTTLPLVMADRLASYRLDEAGAIAILLALLSLVAATASDRMLRHA
jgi:thiamine transport system permease protein